jgi:hypothetical protein
MMKSWVSIMGWSVVLSITIHTASVQAGLKPPPKRWWHVVDDHNGRPGGTGQEATFQTENKNYQLKYSDSCRTSSANYGHFFLGGFAFGHPDPSIKDPKALCGHGIARLVEPPSQGTPPLLIMPVTSPVDPEAENPLQAVADATKVIREQLPRLDKAEGDTVPKVVELRKVLVASDAAKAVKSLPKRTPPPKTKD